MQPERIHELVVQKTLLSSLIARGLDKTHREKLRGMRQSLLCFLSVSTWPLERFATSSFRTTMFWYGASIVLVSELNFGASPACQSSEGIDSRLIRNASIAAQRQDLAGMTAQAEAPFRAGFLLLCLILAMGYLNGCPKTGSATRIQCSCRSSPIHGLLKLCMAC